MTELFRIDLRCIGRQRLDMDFGMMSQVGFCQFATMGARTVPNKDEGSANAATKMLQTLDQFFGIDRTCKTLLEDPATDGKSSHARDFSTILSDPFQVRCFSTRCPGWTDRFREGDAKFIFEHDLYAEPLRFFLSLPNPCSTKRGSAPHPVQAHGFQAFARSNPCHAVND